MIEDECTDPPPVPGPLTRTEGMTDDAAVMMLAGTDPLSRCRHTGVFVEAYAGHPLAEDPTTGVPWRVIAPEQRDLDGVAAYATLAQCGNCPARLVRVRTWDRSSPERVWSSPWVPLALEAPAEPTGTRGQDTGGPEPRRDAR